MIEEEIKKGNENPEENIELTEEDVQKVKSAVKKAQLDATKLSPEQQAMLDQIYKEADMPIILNDKDMVLGKQELDIRKLSTKNWRQMEFRQLILQNIYLKQVVMNGTDLLRLMLVLLKKLGVEDPIQATDDVQAEIRAKEETKQKALEESENKDLN